MKSEHHRCAEMQEDSDDKVTFTETTQSMLTHYRYTARHTHTLLLQTSVPCVALRLGLDVPRLAASV